MATTYDTTVVAAAELRQADGQLCVRNATQVDDAPLTIFELIMMALHESRRRRSEQLLLHDYRHLICPPDQTP
jgi:predicted nucleic acid-binding protein